MKIFVKRYRHTTQYVLLLMVIQFLVDYNISKSILNQEKIILLVKQLFLMMYIS